MTFSDIFKSSFLANVTSVSIFDMTLALILAFGVGIFIYLIYKKTYAGVMYSSSFGVTLVALTLITTLVILAVTSNVVLSLGMVGALSIVRFRTAIKEPMDIALLFWSIAVGIVMAVLGVFILRPAIEIIGVEERMVRDCMVYGIIGMITVPCYMLQFLFQILFVTAEKPRLGFWTTVITGLTNIVLDFFMIVVFHWGVAGASIATGISEVVGGIVPLIYFSRPNDSLLRIGRPRVEFRALRKACTNGLSEFVSTISESVVTMLYNFQLLRLAGADGVAAFGVMQYCTFIFFAVFAGYNMGVQPLFSYNFGADNRVEMKNLFKKSMILMEGGGLMMFAILVIFARPLISIFVGYDADLVDMAVHGMRIYALIFITCGINIFVTGMFTALNNGVVSAFIATVRVVICEIGSVMILPIFFGLNGVWFSASVAEVGSIIPVIIFVVTLRKRYGYAD